MKNTVRYHDHFIEGLKAPSEASAYLDAVAEEGDVAMMLKALRNVVEAQGGRGGVGAENGP